MEFEKILKLIESVSNSELTSFTLEEDGTKLILEARRGRQEAVQSVSVIQENYEQDKKFSVDNGNVVKSPLVGTFYCAPSPDAQPYVKKGDIVSKGQTLGIVEAMKLMNEIECDFDGVIKEILIENGAVVEYGQPLFVIG
ncbi:MAG: acetyl-CoA carboxylase biotin carboxyl carrier protein [Lachnospiraceae bacterium]